MDLSYVDGKVREALMVAKGSRAQATKLIVGAALKDERLMQGLAAPFLKAIVGAAIERVLRRGGGQGAGGNAAPTRAQAALTDDALDAVLSRMGQPPSEPVSPTQSQAARILGGTAPTPRAGERHAQAIRVIAAAFAQKKS
ncbi:MAG TPA: hypothetical protein VEB64_11835 [Azospirillaceae bacterium]|nr:hypothetical protein [Azospirillaceae bacterium]